MRTVQRRLQRLEAPLGIVDGKAREGLRILICPAGWGLALDQDTCMDILNERGFLPSGPEVSLVNFFAVPEGLDAEETAKFLRDNGAQLLDQRSRHEGREAARIPRAAIDDIGVPAR